MRLAVAGLGIAALALAGCQLPAPGAGNSTTELKAQPSFVALNRPATCSGYVALSIDDGPTRTSNQLVEVLAHYKVPAVFFNTGEHTARLPHVIAQERGLPGVQFGNHSWDHPDLSTLSSELARSQIERTRAVQGEQVIFFRPPFGSANSMVDKVVAAAGMVEVLWTHDSKDYDALSTDQIIAQSQGMKDGGILLLHDRPLTAQALPGIIGSYYAKNVCFGKITRSAGAQAPVESPELLFYAKAVAL